MFGNLLFGKLLKDTSLANIPKKIPKNVPDLR
jgi:hypothetical protein